MKSRELELVTERVQNRGDRRDAFEEMRDAAAEHYRAEIGEVWRPRHGSHVSHTAALTSAAIDARDFQRARKDRETRAHLPAGTLVAIAGGKDLTDPGAVFHRLDQTLAKYDDHVLVHGGGPGTDRLAAKWAERNTVHATEEDPDDESLKADLPARIKRRGGLPPRRPTLRAHSPTYMWKTTACQTAG